MERKWEFEPPLDCSNKLLRLARLPFRHFRSGEKLRGPERSVYPASAPCESGEPRRSAGGAPRPERRESDGDYLSVARILASRRMRRRPRALHSAIVIP